MISEWFKGTVDNLLSIVGVKGRYSLKRLAGGANNRVFRVDFDNQHYLLKYYFRHVDDPRDRLGTEFSFISFAWENGIRCIPCPIICDRENNVAIYEFIEGTRLTSPRITENEILQALDFYQKINHFKLMDSAVLLPIASEACFSISEHLDCVKKRFQNLEMIDDSSEANHRALNFVQGELMVVWDKTVNNVKSIAERLGLSMEKEIGKEDRRLSPSDFGFHNAIVGSSGLLRFIDFEYAGWDDPAKTVCDFFCQPTVRVPIKYYDMFVEKVVSELSDAEIQRQRIAILLQVYKIKWCCILLNDFLLVGGRRRNFALNPVSQEQHKIRQLKKARSMLQAFYN